MIERRSSSRLPDSAIHRRVAEYYAQKLQQHGATARGVDWNSAASQTLRFQQLLRVRADARAFSINDYGCGYGALVEYLVKDGASFRYCGFDIAEHMVACAIALHTGMATCTFVSDETRLSPADFTVASGIFNVKLDVPDDDWSVYLLDTLQRLNALSLRGFAFNALSLYSDVAKRRADLHYADPLVLFDYCRRTFSPRVSLLHDYPLYEFTILVRRPEVA